MTTLAAPVIDRDYQIEAAASFQSARDVHRAQLIVSATGTGKTTMFVRIAEAETRFAKRVMVVVDRVELVQQAVDRFKTQANIVADIERGNLRADEGFLGKSRVVVATIQSLMSGDPARYQRFDWSEFGLVIIDEAHLFITRQRRKFIDHCLEANENLSVLGVTATPDRHDRQAMGKVFKRVAYRYEMPDAIDDGWLVPVEGRVAVIEHLDLSVLPSTRKDYTDAQISQLMRQDKAAHEATEATLQHCGDEATLVFCANVAHAELAAALLNEKKPDSARVVSGTTPEVLRRSIIRDYKAGRFQYLCNCNVLTTGFDAPNTRHVVIARPTKSRALFAQMVGRGTRPLPGVVDGPETPEDRIAAIAASAKPCLTVLSLIGKDGNLHLAGPEDVLGGRYDDKVVERAKALPQDQDVRERLEQAQQEIDEEEAKAREREARARARFDAKASTRTRSADLFSRGEHIAAKGAAKGGLTQAQRRYLEHRMYPEDVAKLEANPGYAKGLIGHLRRREEAGLSSYKQNKQLHRLGLVKPGETETMTRDRASELLAPHLGMKGRKRA